MSKYLKISNKTEIEKNAFLLIGACTKREDDSKIGYYGSGLKYAIAVLVRNGIDFDVYAGTQKIDIGVQKENFRGKDFDVITICGEKSNLTTEMGIDWKLWQSIREIYCNALDENCPELSNVDEINPIEGETAFYIQTSNEQIEAIISNWDKYFSVSRAALTQNEDYQIYNRIDETVCIYRKGIRCYDSCYKSLYDYGFKNIDITESRLIRYEFQIKEKMAEIWAKMATTKMIDSLVNLYKTDSDLKANEFIEGHIDWYYSGHFFNQNWLAALKEKLLIPDEYAGWFMERMQQVDCVKLPTKLVKRLKEVFGDEIKSAFTDLGYDFCILEPTKKQTFLLSECMKFFEEVGLKIISPIKIAAFNGCRGILGKATDGDILLSDKLFNMGRKRIVEVIVEESAHLESKAGDGTREYQNYLIGQMITMLENQHGIFL